jgi:hypothetical protein
MVALRALTGWGYFLASALRLRRGLRANHQMLAIVPTMPTVAATGLTTFRAPLFGMGEDTTRRDPGPARPEIAP